MAAIITNLRSMQGMGIFADRTSRSPSLQFRRYNLIYGFNGSGKSTLSRLFASLEAGALHPKLPSGCSFEVTLDDGTVLGCPSNLIGLERRLLVFNSDYIEQNLQWAAGRASPVFFIGADQAEAAAELTKLEGQITKQAVAKTAAEAAEKAADKSFAIFKRERAKLTASRLHLGSRKYEAPALAKDYEAWNTGGAALLTETQLKAAEDTRRLDEPMPRLVPLEFNTSNIETAYQDVMEACGQSLTTVALKEVQRFPDMLLWLKEGQKFHETNGLEDCLFCGNAISIERRALLASAFDDQVDQFVAKLAKTADGLQSVISTLAEVEEAIPTPDALVVELRVRFKDIRDKTLRAVRQVRTHLGTLHNTLAKKRERPATPADISAVAQQDDVVMATKQLAQAIEAMNAAIAEHNHVVENFAKHRDDAELAIRKHFIAECRVDYADHADGLEKARAKLAAASEELEKLTTRANELRQAIKEHGPAAGAINKLIASYLGHQELTIHPVEQGYQLHRHGQPIRGVPSEGEKTAIAISYFLSSIEAEGRKLKNLIVVVDDPVSSLDSKALNYACALVRSRLNDAGQLFVLTHNLQCMNEFRKAWKGRAKPPEGKDPTATFLFIDVAIPTGQDKRSSTIIEMPSLLRDYDSEYHFLFSHILRFVEVENGYYDHHHMIPNVLRRVLEVFLAFKCPGDSGLTGQIKELCAAYSDLDRDRLAALERLAHVESHSDNLDDLLSASSMTVEETRAAARALIDMMDRVDGKHLASMRRLCRRAESRESRKAPLMPLQNAPVPNDSSVSDRT